MALCQGAAIARRYGWTVAFTREDLGCAIAGHSYGWNRVTDKKGASNFFVQMGYARNDKAANEIFDNFRLLDEGNELKIIYSPLERTKIEPDVILIYINPAQMMRLIHGATYHTGKPLTCSFSGRAASCTEGIIGAYLDKDVKVVVPGNGDRVWATCQDHEIIMAIYGFRLPELLEGLKKTHDKGVRYPIPTYLKYQPEVGFTIPLSDVFKTEEIKKFTQK